MVRKTGTAQYHLVEGDTADLFAAIREVSKRMAAPIDLAFVGIGENGEVALHDPPADFETHEFYIAVELDGACRRQQVREGWFSDISRVPARAISTPPPQIRKAREIISVVPDLRKERAVKMCLEGEIPPAAPASF